MARVIGVGLMLGLWLFVSGLVSSAELHHWLHEDSHEASHHCLVTDLTKGAPPFDDAPRVMAPCLPAGPRPVRLESQYFAISDHRVSSGRAPPSVSPPLRVIG